MTFYKHGKPWLYVARASLFVTIVSEIHCVNLTELFTVCTVQIHVYNTYMKKFNMKKLQTRLL